jgi:phosphate uptake regulator
MSRLSLAAVNDSVEAFLRRDYVMADSVVDKVENIHSVESEIISILNKEDKTTSNEPINSNIRLILEDIRRTAEHASDIAEAAMNQTIGEVITVERNPTTTTTSSTTTSSTSTSSTTTPDK